GRLRNVYLRRAPAGSPAETHPHTWNRARLDVRFALPPDAGTTGAAVDPVPESGMNVLIVDDQSSARTMLRHVVEAIGPGVRASDFGSPVDALRWSESHSTDLVLLDYRMPDMDGLEFARRFRRPLSRRDVPIVLISV